MPRPRKEADPLAPARPQAYGVTQETDVSVTRMVREGRLSKFVLEIHRSEDPKALDPVPVVNGDYQVLVRRGQPVVASEATISVLRDANTGILQHDERGKATGEVQDVPSYPFTAIPYDGDARIGTPMDMRTMRPVVKQ